MSNRLKIVTVVGTRPEIIRLSSVIKLLDAHTELVLVHTGQNYDYELNEVFFEDLGLRAPNHFLEADTSSLGIALGTIISGTEKVLLEEMVEINGTKYMQGHTERYVKVVVNFDENSEILRQNHIVAVKIQGFLDENLLYGKVSIEF